MRSLETYSNWFENSDSGRNASDVGSIKSFYWSSMAEATFEMRNDINAALDCCKRAVIADTNSTDARIIACKILLEVSGCLIYDSGIGMKPRRTARYVFVCEDVDPEAYLNETLKVGHIREHVITLFLMTLFFLPDVSESGKALPDDQSSGGGPHY
jgi:hypothetical protein